MVEFLESYWYFIGAGVTFAVTLTYCIVSDDNELEDEILASLIMGCAWLLVIPIAALVVIVGTLKDKYGK